MNLIVLAAVVIAVAVVVQVIVMVPAVLQLRRTLSASEEFIRSMEGSLKALIEDDVRPMVRAANNALVEVEGVARGAREGVEKIEDTLEAFHEVGQTVRSLNRTFNEKIKGAVINLSASMVGIKAGFLALVEALRRTKQKEVA